MNKLLSILVEDVLEIITVFSAKLHWMRSRKNVAALQDNLKKLAQLEQENWVQ